MLIKKRITATNKTEINCEIMWFKLKVFKNIFNKNKFIKNPIKRANIYLNRQYLYPYLVLNLNDKFLCNIKPTNAEIG